MPFFFSFSICASSSANEILALDLIAIFGSTGCSLTGSVSAATVSLTDSFSFVSVSGATVSSTCVEVSSTGVSTGMKSTTGLCSSTGSITISSSF